MKLILAFFKLIRWPNLAFIALTQVLFYFCVFIPLLTNRTLYSQNIFFLLLVISSVLIAAAGYIINDYFDVKIDTINKPERIVIGKIIKRRWAIVLHWLFSGIGVLLSFYISYGTKLWPIFFINLFCVFTLWVYSTTFKKKLLVGNLIIAALTAWTILVVYLFVGANLFSFQGFNSPATFWHNNFDERKLFKFTLLYASFAFIMTLIREVVKDLEDMEGDRKYDCNTMPIAWGVPATKVFTAVWIVVAIAALVFVQLYAWQTGKWISALYFILCIVLPLFYLLKQFRAAITTVDYAKLSGIIKLIILAGILSMILLKFGV